MLCQSDNQHIVGPLNDPKIGIKEVIILLGCFFTVASKKKKSNIWNDHGSKFQFFCFWLWQRTFKLGILKDMKERVQGFQQQ